MIYLRARDMPGPLTVALCRLCGFQVPPGVEDTPPHIRLAHIIPAAYCLSQFAMAAIAAKWAWPQPPLQGERHIPSKRTAGGGN